MILGSRPAPEVSAPRGGRPGVAGGVERQVTPNMDSMSACYGIAGSTFRLKHSLHDGGGGGPY